MKDFIEKILDSKYTATVVIVLVAIILIIVGYLIYIQYIESKDVDIYSNAVDVYPKEEEIIEVKEESKKDEPEVKEEPKKEEKIELLASYDIITKGKNVGKALKKDKSTGDIFTAAQAFLNSKEKVNITTDTVVSLDISKLNNVTKDAIKQVNAKVFNAEGKAIFNNNIAHKYDKITFAVDELEESTIYYAVITITLKNNTVAEYVFKF